MSEWRASERLEGREPSSLMITLFFFHSFHSFRSARAALASMWYLTL